MRCGFTYVLEKGWPPLAWLAECVKGRHEVYVHHGPGVETREDWFCEAVWDGDFEAGEFDRTDLVFGTGGRMRSGIPVFVSSGATVDRLQFLQEGSNTFVSNSLACLKSLSAGWPDVGFAGYRRYFYSISGGIDKYVSVVPDKGANLVYFSNLRWDGKGIGLADKPFPERHLSSFDDYVGFLHESLERIGANLSSPSRGYKLEPVGTISSGYDSGTASAVARSAGLSEVISFATAREELVDDGSEIAERLGLQVRVFDRLAWRSEPMIEVPFIAADAEGGELFFAGAGDQLNAKVLFTGNHGDKVWGKEPEVPLTSKIVGGGCSGLSLTEYRLMLGTIHLPVPYIGVRHIRDIVDVSNCPEMAPWDIGGDYNRPICRRILEEAGVPRHLFGIRKKAVASLFRHGDVCLTYATRKDFHQWCSSHASELTDAESDRPVKAPVLARWFIPEIWLHAETLVRRVLRILPKPIEESLGWRLTQFSYRLNKLVNALVPWAFPWALENLARRYYPATVRSRREQRPAQSDELSA